jgi:protein ImuB
MTPPVVGNSLLWCPDWPVTAVSRAGGIAGRAMDAPIALIEKGLVFACSAAARASGVSRGIRVREAQSRCADLEVYPYDPALDHRAFDPVIEAVEQFASGVQVLRPGVCAVRGRGPSRFYGGEKPAALALLGILDELGIAGSRVGVADGPFTAEQAARSATSVRIIPAGGSAAFLDPLPIGVLDAPDIVPLLNRLGLHTLGDFAALPEAHVAGRFGDQGARLHALASGRDSRQVIARIPPAELDCSIDFEPPLDRVDQVAFSVRASADLFIERLTGVKLVCTAIRVETDSESGEHAERSWLHPRSFTASDVVDRVRWQLQGAGTGESGLSSAIVRVRIFPESVDAIGNHEEGLWGTGHDARVHHGLSRVQSMLGHGAVLTAAVGGGRMLAERQELVPWGDRPAVRPRTGDRPWPGHLPAPLPATVFAIPRPVDLVTDAGDSVRVDARGNLNGAPARFSSTGSARDLTTVLAWAGPWPVDQRWWSENKRSLHRFQVVDEDSSAWLLILENGNWLAEARYD